MGNFNDSIIKTIATTEFYDLASEFGEISIDSITDNEVIKELPFVKTLFAIYKVPISIRDRFLIKKLINFLSGLNGVSQLEKSKFIQEMNTNKTYSERVAEHLLILLDKIDEVEKADLIAKIFKEYIAGRIVFVDWLRLANIIERTLLHNLTNLTNYYSTNLT